MTTLARILRNAISLNAEVCCVYLLWAHGRLWTIYVFVPRRWVRKHEHIPLIVLTYIHFLNLSGNVWKLMPISYVNVWHNCSCLKLKDIYFSRLFKTSPSGLRISLQTMVLICHVTLCCNQGDVRKRSNLNGLSLGYGSTTWPEQHFRNNVIFYIIDVKYTSFIF